MFRKNLALTALIFLSVFAPICKAANFSDVPSSHWAKSFIEDAASQNILSGYANGNFGLGDDVTATQAYKIVFNATDQAVRDQQSGEAWYEPFIDFYEENGYDGDVENGDVLDSDHAVENSKSLSRGKAIYLILKAAGVDIPVADQKEFRLHSVDPQLSFSDVKKENPYVLFIEFAAQNGIVNGYEDGTFGASNSLKREEFVKMVMNTVQNKKDVLTDENVENFLSSFEYDDSKIYTSSGEMINVIERGTPEWDEWFEEQVQNAELYTIETFPWKSEEQKQNVLQVLEGQKTWNKIEDLMKILLNNAIETPGPSYEDQALKNKLAEAAEIRVIDGYAYDANGDFIGWVKNVDNYTPPFQYVNFVSPVEGIEI